jgi:RNA polymerase sigma-70 factor (ECF subfamily)
MTSPATRPSLLIRIADPKDSVAWAEFVAIYEPVLERVAKARGLQADDAKELAQEVLITVMHSISRFEISPRVGSFRRWLATIVGNKIHDFFRAANRHTEVGSRSRVDLHGLKDESLPDIDEQLESQWRHQMFAEAVDAIRNTVEGETWLAFWRTSIDLVPAEEVAQELGVSIGNIYVARSRVISKLRKWVQDRTESDWEGQS